MTAWVPYVGKEEVKDKILVARCFIAELIGTMFLVIIACGSCYGNSDVPRIAFAFGLTVATLAQSIGHISGCHINPAVTCGLFVGGKIGAIKGVIYLIAQVLGGLIGGYILKFLVNGPAGATGLNGIDAGQGFAIEFFITFLLVLVVFGAAADENNTPNVKGSAPLAIGLSITTCHMFAVSYIVIDV